LASIGSPGQLATVSVLGERAGRLSWPSPHRARRPGSADGTPSPTGGARSVLRHPPGLRVPEQGAPGPAKQPLGGLGETVFAGQG